MQILPETSQTSQVQSKFAINDILDSYEIQFHIFVSPEFKIDPNTCKIGIYTSHMKWNMSEMRRFKIVKYKNSNTVLYKQ